MLKGGGDSGVSGVPPCATLCRDHPELLGCFVLVSYNDSLVRQT